MAEIVTPVVPDAVSRIQAMLDLESKPATPEPQKQAAPEAQPETEVKEAEPEAQPNKTVEGEEAPQEDAPKGVEIPEDQLEAIELEVKEWAKDGKRVPSKRTIKELREGYMRLDDYSRNIQDVAKQREDLSKSTREAIEGERTQYAKTLQELQTIILETAAPELKDVNWNHLAANDPFEYVKLRNRADQITKALSEIQTKQKELSEKQQSERGESLKAQARKAVEILEADIPGWNDTLYQNLLKSSESVGYKREEAATWVDPRAMKLLHKAYLYDQLKAGKPTDNKVVTAPRVVKPGASQPNQAQAKHAEAMKKLQGNGSIDNAADVIRARLGG